MAVLVNTLAFPTRCGFGQKRPAAPSLVRGRPSSIRIGFLTGLRAFSEDARLQNQAQDRNAPFRGIDVRRHVRKDAFPEGRRPALR